MSNLYIRKEGQGSLKQRERIITRALYIHLKENHPHVQDFFFDWAAGQWFADPGLRKSRASLSSGRGWADLFIPYPMTHTLADGSEKTFHGLFLEIKKEDTKIYVTDPKTKEKRLAANEQIQLQAPFLERMNDMGYCGMFGIGLEDCKAKLDWYLKRPKLFDDGLEF
jgi:hypothetical protein